MPDTPIDFSDVCEPAPPHPYDVRVMMRFPFFVPDAPVTGFFFELERIRAERAPDVSPDVFLRQHLDNETERALVVYTRRFSSHPGFCSPN